jgi:hypothetical protein
MNNDESTKLLPKQKNFNEWSWRILAAFSFSGLMFLAILKLSPAWLIGICGILSLYNFIRCLLLANNL